MLTSCHHDVTLEEVFSGACAGFGATLPEFNGEAGHVHLLVSYPPALAISVLAMHPKGTCSRALRSEFPDSAGRLDTITGSGRTRTSPHLLVARRSQSCAGTSSNRTDRHDWQRRFTTQPEGRGTAPLIW